MARLRSSQLPPEAPEQLGGPSPPFEEDELEAGSDADGGTPFSTVNENIEEKGEEVDEEHDLEQKPSNAAFRSVRTITRTPSLAKRIFGFLTGGTPRSNQAADENGSDRGEKVVYTEAPGTPTPARTTLLKYAGGQQGEDEGASLSLRHQMILGDEDEENLLLSPVEASILRESSEYPVEAINFNVDGLLADDDEAQHTSYLSLEEDPVAFPRSDRKVGAPNSEEDEEQQGPEVAAVLEHGLAVLEGSKVNDSTLQGIPPQTTEETPAAEELPPSSNAKMNRLLKAKPAIQFNDNSFHYTKSNDVHLPPPKKDIYEVPTSPAKGTTAKKIETKKNTAPKKTEAKKKTYTKKRGGQASKTINGTTTDDNDEAPKLGDGLLDVVEVSSSPPKRRGRPPKDSQKAKIDDIPLDAIDKPDIAKDSGLSKTAEACTMSNENLLQESSSVTRRPRGRPKATQNEDILTSPVSHPTRAKVSSKSQSINHEKPLQTGIRKSTVEPSRTKSNKKLVATAEEEMEVQERLERSIERDIQENPVVKVPKKRTNIHLQVPEKPSKRAKANDVGDRNDDYQDFEEQYDSPEPEVQRTLARLISSRSMENDIQEIPVVKVPKKRTNSHLQVPERSSKRAKTTDVDLDDYHDVEEQYASPEPVIQSKSSRLTSSRSQSQAAPKRKPINLIMEVAKAEEHARKKLRESKNAIRAAEDAEKAAERWRNRLAVARQKAVAQERVAKGLPPLKPERRSEDPFSVDFEEDLENGVERVEGVFGTNNLSHVTPAAFSSEEKDEIIRGLYEERKASNDERVYNIFKRDIFRRTNRSYDEVLEKVIEFKEVRMETWEKERARDPNVKPIESWIASIPDRV